MLDQYLAKFSSAVEVHLVGPLTGGSREYPEPVVFVDGGGDYRIQKKGISVGDGDSAISKMDVKLNYSKDYSDLAFVLNYLPRTLKKIYFHGFLGGRRDHELMNFAEIHRFLKGKNSTRAVMEDQVLAFSAGDYEVEIAGLFSLFLFEDTDLEVSGDCEYSTSGGKRIIPLSSHGLSNTGSGLVNLKCNGPVFIFKSIDTQ